ncbi:uncharacterized protein LOC119509657 [Choloepus didactylus]|uniref:uncharacterized protein LOC119509657 n=1 Tax=Choloepus didactylus TaxID=27675 RepID=UPI00189F2DFF|nr:uncharacterized protein LOC119509657 [Choloepus didactylus]
MAGGAPPSPAPPESPGAHSLAGSPCAPAPRAAPCRPRRSERRLRAGRGRREPQGAPPGPARSRPGRGQVVRVSTCPRGSEAAVQRRFPAPALICSFPTAPPAAWPDGGRRRLIARIMKVAPMLVLLGVLLCAGRVQGLRCYKCLGASPGSSCAQDTCLFPNGVCVFHQVTAMSDSKELKMENKLCLPFCPGKDTQIPGTTIVGTVVKTKLYCCKEDLCNGIGKAVGSAWALGGGLLLSLAVTLLWVPLW